MPTFHAIAALSENRVIGHNGKMPWHIPGDLRWFKHKTMSGILVMGRKTFDAIGEPLPGRETLIVSRQPSSTFPLPTYTLATLFNDYVAKHPDETYWVCGGGEIYTQLLDHCACLYLTLVKRHAEGDTFFPSAVHVEKTHVLDQVIHDEPLFRVERWINKNLPPAARPAPESWPFPVNK